MTSTRLFVVWVTVSSWIPVLSSLFNTNGSASLGWKSRVVVVNMSICVYKFSAAFLLRGHSLIQVSTCWKERQPLRAVITDAPSEESWWKSAQVLVASGSLLWVVTHERWSSKFGFQVDSKLTVVPGKVQAQHKVHLHLFLPSCNDTALC